MKILVAVCIILYMVFMGTVVTIGFLQKQQKEAAIPTPSHSNTSSNSTTDNSTSNTNTTDNTTTTSPSSTAKTFTAAQVATHNKPANCWLIIHGSVFDVTSFLDQHPGGMDVIIPYCGKDASQAFDTQGGRRGGHSSSAKALLQDYKVGTVQ
jgi:cytochrome b involved in lipid metabolism